MIQRCASVMILALTLAAGPAAAEDSLPTGIAVPWLAPTGQGVGIGYEFGQWGQGFAQGLRLKVPLRGGWGTTLRGIMAIADDPARWSAGGRLELYGQSPVLLNLVRIYGGGGPQIFHQVKGDHQGETRFGGGGQFGFEFFMSPRVGFFLEVGGNGNGHLVGGATVMTGITIYPR
jgi:hypothetical protein